MIRLTIQVKASGPWVHQQPFLALPSFPWGLPPPLTMAQDPISAQPRAANPCPVLCCSCALANPASPCFALQLLFVREPLEINAALTLLIEHQMFSLFKNISIPLLQRQKSCCYKLVFILFLFITRFV